MTGRATFGDFLGAAHQHLSLDGASRGRAVPGKDVFDVCQSLSHLVKVMGHCIQDVAAAYDDAASHGPQPPNVWARAAVEARDALGHATVLLRQTSGGRRITTRAESELGQRLEAAAGSLAAGRDLLQTHFALGTDGARQHRSDWGMAITSRPVSRALLAEMASLAGRAARLGSGLELASATRGSQTLDARRKLDTACRWLGAVTTSVSDAHREEPVPARDRELLRAVPVNAVPPRRLPEGTEPVSVLCEGVIGSAERVRQAAWGSAERAPWSPGMSITSLRKIAATSTATSHNCQVILRSLAARAAEPGFGGHSQGLAAAAEAAERSRDSWLAIAQSLDHVTTDTRGQLNRPAVEAGDLALWTGRLAYADPGWTLATGPAQPARSPEDLAARPEDVPQVVAATHQTCETLTRLAETERAQVRVAARAGRILVPTRSLPEDADIPRCFVSAPESRVDLLVSRYGSAHQANWEATAAVGEVAEAVRAPSRILTAARAATEGDRDVALDASLVAASGTSAERRVPREEQRIPGPVKRTLLDLGVNRADLLRRGAEMDRDSEHLISEATPGLDPTAGNFDLARQFTGQAAAPGLSAKDMERQRAAAEMPPPGAAAHTRAPGPCTSPAPPPNRSSRTPAVSQPQAPSADWRDTVIETGRQAWQPRVVQPYAPFPSPPQVNGPEIGG